MMEYSAFLLLVFKIVFLTLAIVYGFACFGRLYRKQPVYQPQIFFMGLGMAGFIALQWLI